MGAGALSVSIVGCWIGKRKQKAAPEPRAALFPIYKPFY
jgi:hypothetical protein